MLDAVMESVTSVSRLVMMGTINKPMHVSMIVHSLDVVMDIITSTWRLAMMATNRMPTTAPTHARKQLVVMEPF